MMMMMMLFFCWKHCRKCQAPETSQFIHSVKKKKRTSTRWTKWHFTSKHFTIWSSFDNNNSEQKRKPVFLLFSELSCKWTSTLNGQRKKNQNQSQTNKKTFIKIDSFIISILKVFFCCCCCCCQFNYLVSVRSFVRCIHSKKKMINSTHQLNDNDLIEFHLI